MVYRILIISTGTDNDQNMLGSSLGNEPGFLVMSRSERSVHANNGRPRATTQANYNPKYLFLFTLFYFITSLLLEAN